MKTYILIFILIFVAHFSVLAQKQNPCNGNPRPIAVQNINNNTDPATYTPVNLPHNPCYQAVNVYTVLKENPGATINWRVVRSEMSEIPAEGWVIVDENDNSQLGSPEGYTITLNGKEYFAASIRAGRKAGVIKATVTDPACGTGTKVATLTVRPGELMVNITEGECVDDQKTFTATATPSKHPNNTTGFLYQWTFPEGWSHPLDTDGDNVVTIADVNTITLTTDANPGTVSVDVVAAYKGNNGQGVGNANCEFGANEIVSEPCMETTGCPAGESITGESLGGSEMTITYQGATTSGSNTTVSFSFASETTLEEIIVQPLIFDPLATTVTTSTNNADYTGSFDTDFNEIVYTREGGATGTTNLVVSFTIPTDDFIQIFGFVVEDINGGGILTTYIGEVEGEEETCIFQPLTPFAVELATFQGKATASGIELTWTTASETDNDRFEVQRSSDGKDYKTVGTVKGAGNSASALNYSYTDKSANKGTNYYRLKLVETSGKSEFSKVIAIESTKATRTGVTLYPNPASGNNLTIAVDGKVSNNRDYLISITDMNGRKVFEQQLSSAGNSEIKLSLDQLKITKGLYMVKVQGDNSIETQKLLIK